MTHRRPATTAVPINGARVRELRITQGTSIADLATTVDISDSYLRGIETGHTTRVGPAVFNRLLDALSLEDREALLPEPEPAEAGAA